MQDEGYTVIDFDEAGEVVLGNGWVDVGVLGRVEYPEVSVETYVDTGGLDEVLVEGFQDKIPSVYCYT